jgi:hypothetical protein
VRTDVRTGGVQVPVTFPSSLSHSAIADRLVHAPQLLAVEDEMCASGV